MQVEQKKICANEYAVIYRYSIIPNPSKPEDARKMIEQAILNYRELRIGHNIYIEEANPFDVLIVEYSNK